MCEWKTQNSFEMKVKMILNTIRKRGITVFADTIPFEELVWAKNIGQKNRKPEIQETNISNVMTYVCGIWSRLA